MESISLQTEKEWGIVESFSPQAKAAGYRFYPGKVKGEGFFMACFRKKNETSTPKLRPARPEKLSSREKDLVEQWTGKQEDLTYFKFKEQAWALSPGLFNDFCELQPQLNVLSAGLRLGQLMKDKLVPDHALALSLHIAGGVPFTELDDADAIRYLQKQEMQVKPRQTGWQLVRYRGHNLGWINALKNRINNYYPKELRILKQYIHPAVDK